MSRTLGSFNRRVNLPSHPEDTQLATPRRIAALRPEVIPQDRGGTTGAEKFVAGRGRSVGRRGPENRRFAGDIMNINISAGTVPTQTDNPADLSYGQEGTVGIISSSPSGRYIERINADLKKRSVMQTQTGQNIKISSGLQAAFAPPLAGAAETRSSAYSTALPDLYYYQG
jgi:hypothetical protein